MKKLLVILFSVLSFLPAAKGQDSIFGKDTIAFFYKYKDEISMETYRFYTTLKSNSNSEIITINAKAGGKISFMDSIAESDTIIEIRKIFVSPNDQTVWILFGSANAKIISSRVYDLPPIPFKPSKIKESIFYSRIDTPFKLYIASTKKDSAVFTNSIYDLRLSFNKMQTEYIGDTLIKIKSKSIACYILKRAYYDSDFCDAQDYLIFEYIEKKSLIPILERTFYYKPTFPLQVPGKREGKLIGSSIIFLK